MKNGILFIKKIGDGIYDFVDKYNNKELYVFDFEDVKKEYLKVLKIYGYDDDLINLKDFSKNYSFGFHMKKNLLDHQSDSNKMTEQIHEYLISLKEKGDI